jgi:hypothetical protein
VELGDKVKFQKELMKKNYSFTGTALTTEQAKELNVIGKLDEKYKRYSERDNKKILEGIVCGKRTIKYKGYSNYIGYEEGYGFESEPHITVLYGIHEQEPNIVKESINLNPVEYEITGLSLFENDDYDVLKCSIKSKDLKKLNKECCDSLEYTNDYPDYIPHLTVAYLLPGRGKKYTKLKSKSFNKSKKSNKFFFSNKDSEKTYWKV